MKNQETELEALAGRLRAQVAQGRYPEAQGALHEYCQALRKTVATLPRGDPGLAGCGKSDPESCRPKHFIVELFYARRRHSTDDDVQLPLT
jgi:hypothetical protein